MRRGRTNEEINILLKQRNIVKVYKSSGTYLHGWDIWKECMKREQRK
jgi:hypothetical protein